LVSLLTSMRKQICVGVVLVAAATGLLGCTEYEDSEEATARELARLRSLPYGGGTHAGEDDSVGVVLLDTRYACPGYRLYAMQMLGRAELIDLEGNVVREWQYPGDRWERAELLANGDLLVVGMEGHGSVGGQRWRRSIVDSSRYVMRLDWEGRLVWKRKLLAHHDVELTPAGKILVLTFRLQDEPDIHATIDTRADYLTLLDCNGNVEESRSLLEAIRNSPEVFDLDVSNAKPSRLGAVPWVDPLHANSVEWMHQEHLFDTHPLYGSDNVLVCFRHQDRVAVFDWEENKVVWAWGADELSGPHDAQVLESGNVLVFDNGLTHRRSRAVEVDPLRDRIVWESPADSLGPFFTISKGSAQRLPNGNTLLAESDKGRAVEIAPEGRVVWEFLCPHGVASLKRAAIVRMIHYPAAFLDGRVTANVSTER